MNRKLIIMTMSMLMMASVAFMTGCKKDDPVGPSVSLSRTDFNGKIGESTSTTATVTAEGGLKTLRITKFIGTTIDNTYGTNGTLTVTGSTHTLNYTLAEEGLQSPIRFKFEAEDNNGKKGSSDFVITTAPSLSYVLVNFNWRLDSKVGKELAAEANESEKVLACEKDNVYTFNANGTMSVNYGALTGSGGGTCDFDALLEGTSWSVNAAETELTLVFNNLFTGPTTEVYRISSFSLLEMKGKINVDLTVFGPEFAIWDWTFTWKAQAK
ncbi:MAG: hypothetical protein IPI60_18075 [Saprospiraceae bacterium]|nr:hypothetical protein [Saprospiraceae bacterium]